MLFVANWKMNKPFSQAVQFCKNNLAELQQLSTSKNKIVICPSFESINAIAQICTNTIAIGAQDCSEYGTGPYTGQVSARSLAESGCSYCIVGHSERRTLCGETNEKIARKVNQLFEQSLVPIICIGETKQEHDKEQTIAVLQAQLAPLVPIIQASDKPFIIAYEPIWSIGTGIIPEPAKLKNIYSWLDAHVASISQPNRWQLLYGGSINETTAPKLQSINTINGYLIGDASLDIQKFKKIVSLHS